MLERAVLESEGHTWGVSQPVLPRRDALKLHPPQALSRPESPQTPPPSVSSTSVALGFLEVRGLS